MRIRKSEQAGWGRRHAWKAAAVFGAAVLLAWSHPMVSLAEATGTVLPNSVNIRKQPDQESEVIGSSTVGKEISIRGKVDVSGITWYQVYIDANNMGYVRADMIEKKGDGDIPTVTLASESQQSQTSEGGEADSQEPAASGSSGGGAQVDAQEAMDLQYASTKVQAKVRPDPSTSNNPVDSLTPGTQVVVSGKSEGSDSKTWYYVTFTASNGSEKTGYIRSDLLELGEMLPMEEEPEEAPEEAPEEEPAAAPRNDYELKIETTSDGEEAWYIYDNVTGQKQKLVPLLESSYSQTLDDGEDTKSIVKQRIVIVVLAVLLTIFVIATVFMAFKLRDAYYEDYEDEEDEEDEEERPAVRRAAERETGRRAAADRERETGRRAAADEERRPRRREDAGEGADRQERRKREREVTYREEPDAEEAVRPARARKAKNFLLDDDEFEFEFLNMDDKDLK